MARLPDRLNRGITIQCTGVADRANSEFNVIGGNPVIVVACQTRLASATDQPPCWFVALAGMDKVTAHLRGHPQFAEGRAEADAAIAAESLGYRIHGKIVWSLCEESASMLKDRFAIQLQFDGNCIVSEEVVAHAEGYNERMREEFLARFGDNVIDSVFREVERKQKKRAKSARRR